jgi:hypothetical protein
MLDGAAAVDARLSDALNRAFSSAGRLQSIRLPRTAPARAAVKVLRVTGPAPTHYSGW